MQKNDANSTVLFAGLLFILRCRVQPCSDCRTTPGGEKRAQNDPTTERYPPAAQSFAALPQTQKEGNKGQSDAANCHTTLVFVRLPVISSPRCGAKRHDNRVARARLHRSPNGTPVHFAVLALYIRTFFEALCRAQPCLQSGDWGGSWVAERQALFILTMQHVY